jgi:poly(A) polymerase
VETDGRRAVVAFTEDWIEDAQRRDFRMNALYAAPDGEVFDPTGGGLDDVAQRRIVFVGDPETRLREDYLRILRFFRFFAWYGRGAPDSAGLAACTKLKSGLDGISAERIWMETKKLLAARDPIPAMTAMEDSGVFRQIFPHSRGLDLLRSLVALERASSHQPDPMLRFLSLFWKDAKAIQAAANKLKMSNDERQRLVWAAQDETPIEADMSGRDLRRALYKVGSTVLRDRVLLQWAGDGSDSWSKLYSDVGSWMRPAIPVSGEDLLARGIAEGPAVGAELRELEAAWIDSDFALTREELLAGIKS